MALVLAHDLGTTGNKASLFDESGNIVASHTEPYAVHYPQPGWAEQEGEDWWRAVCLSTRALLQAARLQPADVRVVSFSGQMMGLLPLDAHGRPLRSAIIWADQRAVDEARWFAERCDPTTVYCRTGHRVGASYVAAKWLWLKRHQPELYAQTWRWVMAKDYAVFKLTGQVATDYSDASGTNLFDLQTARWCEDFVEALQLEAHQLPPLHPSTEVIGEVTREAAAATGLRPGTPVVIGGGDGACATVGAGSVGVGDAYCVIGTSAWIAFTAAQPLIDPQQRTFTFGHLMPQRYIPMGTMQSAGGAREWWLRIAAEEVNDAALAEVPVGSDGVIFLPYLIGERSPWWNPRARGAFLGLSMSHTSAHLQRAVLEGIAMNLKLIFDALSAQQPLTSLRLVGGGARSAVWRQILADVLGVPLAIPQLLAEATSWGAAVAGGVGVGLYPSWEIARAPMQTVQHILPNPEAHVRYIDLLERFRAAYHAVAALV